MPEIMDGSVPEENMGETAMQNRLREQIAELQQFIHIVSSPERKLDTHQLEVVARLGNAAYQMARVADLVSIDTTVGMESSTTELLDDITGPESEIPVGGITLEEVTPSVTEETDEKPTVEVEQDDLPAVNEDVTDQLEVPATPGDELVATESAEEEVDAQEEVGTPAKKQTSLHLTPREEKMLTHIASHTRPGEWFRQNQLQLDMLKFSSESSQRQAFSALARKLIKRGELEDNGKQRGGRKYRFLQTDEAPQQDESVQPVGASDTGVREVFGDSFGIDLSTRHDVMPPRDPDLGLSFQQRREKAEAARFAAELVGSLEGWIDLQQPESARYSDATTWLAEGLEVNVQQAGSMLGSLMANGHFHIERVGGVRSLVKGSKPEAAPAVRGLTKTYERNRWTSVDVDNSRMVLTTLLEFTHVEETIQTTKLVRQLEIPDEDEAKFRATLHKLKRAGYLKMYRGMNRTGTIYAKRRNEQVVRLKDQAIKTRLKNDFNAVMAELTARVSESD